MKIRQKLVLLVVIPLVAVLAFAALAVITTGGQALQADRLRSMVAGNAAAGDLIYALQNERADAVHLLVDGSDDAVADDYLNGVTSTDEAIEAFRQARSEFSDIPSATADTLRRVDTGLDTLDAARDRVIKDEKTATAAAFSYRIIIADLLTFRESVPQAGGAPSDVADRIRASTMLTQISEYVSIQQETVIRALAKGELSAAAQQEITAANTGITDSMLSYQDLASVEWRGWLEQTQSGNDMIEVQVLEDSVVRAAPGDELSVESPDWSEGMNLRMDRLKEVQDKVDAAVVDDITDLRTDQLWWTGAQVAGVLVAVLIALIMAMRLGGPVVRGLRRLASTAHNVATEGLPKAVAQLDDHEVLGDRTPEEFAKSAVAPIEVRGKDELADVGRAFNEVHQEAIRVAAAQALLRLHIGSMFVRLARRGHSLTGRLTSVLDEAERNEDDPDRLERLFALDHLVTLFGRTNDSLLVLGGAAPSRVRRTNETVSNVLTAAQSQIEQYTRVQIDGVDDVLSIKAGAVDDVVKLLAELLDNATEYSQHNVNMFARLLADRLIIQINDRGIGIKPEILDSLNMRLTSRSALDLNSVQTMGLTVVGHIAARHNISVELRQAPTGGTLAEVSLPADLLEEPSAPKELPSAEQDPHDGVPHTPRRRAALFDKANKGKNRKSKNAKRRAQRDQAAPVVESSVVTTAPAPSADDTRQGAMGLPVVRFDQAANSAATADKPPTPEPQAVPPDQSPEPVRRPALFDKGAKNPPRLPSDPGWKAAKTAQPAEPDTSSGLLPKREPMAHLVPGSMESEADETESNAAYRNPNTVSATYVAYARARAGAGRPQSPSSES